MYKIEIEFNQITLQAELNDCPTSTAILEQLPIEGLVNTWGDEIYFEIPVDLPQEPGAKEILEPGDLGYWPVGKAFCIFFGPTPVSTDERPRAYSPVNVLGHITTDLAGLETIQKQQTVNLVRLEETKSEG